MSGSDVREEALTFMVANEAKPVHVRHVAVLALQLFDQLATLHGLGSPERLLLEVAALLHDIGHQVKPSVGGHHNESARMIRENAWKHFSRADVEIVAQVARYHRKELPEFSHEGFGTLSRHDQEVVQKLAAMLRLADAFDRSHAQHIGRIRVELSATRIVFHLETEWPVLREVMAARLKGDLAEAVFQRELKFMFDGEEMKAPV